MASIGGAGRQAVYRAACFVLWVLLSVSSALGFSAGATVPCFVSTRLVDGQAAQRCSAALFCGTGHATRCMKGASRCPLRPALSMSSSESRGTVSVPQSALAQSQNTAEKIDSVICFDGGCSASDLLMKEELERDLKELSDTEQRLRDAHAGRSVPKDAAPASPSLAPQQGRPLSATALSPTSAEEAAPPVPRAPDSASSFDGAESVISRRLGGRSGPTVWTEFGALAAQTKGVNLGQGFPNWSPPEFVTQV